MQSRKLLKAVISLLFVFVFFSGALFASAYFANFNSSVQNFDVTLDPLEASDTNFTLSIDSFFGVLPPPDQSADAPYYIAPKKVCNAYDEDFNCVDEEPNLCPYISLEPQNEEATEIGFNRNPDNLFAFGLLNRPEDPTDVWKLAVQSPCFEGECPADYDPNIDGAPLPQALKGETFKCNLFAETNEIPVPVGRISPPKTLNDDAPNSIEISAVFTGELPGCTADCFSNVLFLPGLEASRLYKTRTDGSEDQLWEPNSNSDVEDLYLNTDGTSVNPDIYTRDIITEGHGIKNIYKSFSETMDALVEHKKIIDWEPYAYDWRQSVDDIVAKGTKYENGNLSLVDTLQSLVDSSKNGKVTIVAHSNGGLLAKALLKKLQADKDAGINNLIDSVDVLVLVASPQIGTATAVSAVLHGYGQNILGGLFLNEIHARELGRNMLGGYGLLPSREYVNHVSASPATFMDTVIPSNVTTNLVQAFGSAIDSYPEYKSFLFGGEGRINPAPSQTNLPISLLENLFSQSENLHSTIDSFIPPITMRVIEVAGWGLDTVASMEYYPKLVCNGTSCQHILDQRPRYTVDGDKTVVVPSAHYMNFLGNAEKYWVDIFKYNSTVLVNREHKDILEIDPILSFISKTIQQLPLDNSIYISTTTPVDPKNRFRISIHSPVTIDAYDAEENHTGKVCTLEPGLCSIEENIPNSSYMEFGEGKYINLPEDQLETIKLKGIGTGTFTYEMEKVLPDGTSSTSAFVNVPVNIQTKAEIFIDQDTGMLELELDNNGDGVVDNTLEVIQGNTLVYDSTPPEVSITFSTTAKDLVFTGLDASPTTVTTSNTNTKVVDNQGNTSILNYTKDKKFQKTTLTLSNIVRNGAVTTLPNTYLQYDWSESSGVITDINTRVFINGVERYVFSYNKSKNTTIITEKIGKITQTKIIKGFVNVNARTEGGTLTVIY